MANKNSIYRNYSTESLRMLVAIHEQSQHVDECRTRVMSSQGNFDDAARDYAVATCKLKHLHEDFYRERKLSNIPEFDVEDVKREIASRTRSPRWGKDEVEDLIEMYPTTDNKELSNIFGVSVSAVIKKANELGVSKVK